MDDRGPGPLDRYPEGALYRAIGAPNVPLVIVNTAFTVPEPSNVPNTEPPVLPLAVRTALHVPSDDVEN